MARVASLTPNHPVVRVTGLRVIRDEPRASGKTLAILELHVHGVVAILSKFAQCFLIQPVTPIFLDMIDGIVNAWCGKVLLVRRPSVVVTQGWHHRDFLVLDRVFDDVSANLCVICDFLLGIPPNSMRRVVASPEDCFRFDIRGYKLHHTHERLFREVTQTLVRTPFTSDMFTFFCWPI